MGEQKRRGLRGYGRAALAVGAVIVVVAGLAVGVPHGNEAVAQAPAKPASAGASVPVETTTVQSGPLRQTIALTGELQPQDKVQVLSRTSARVTAIPVEVGQAVATGDVLVEVDRAGLEAALSQAQAQVASARANLKKIEAGARPEDLAAAQAQVRQAAEQLAQAQTNAGAVREQEVANAEASVASAEARLRQVTQGPSEAEVASAEASLRGAQARLQLKKNGARVEDIAVAEQTVNQQRQNRAKVESQLSNSKEQARIAIEQASSALASAQAKYGAAQLLWEQADRTDKDPNIPKCSPLQGKSCNDLTDSKRRQYKSEFEAAAQALYQAEQTVEQRQLAYEDAKQQEIAGLRQADAQIQSAQASLEKLKAGNTSDEIADVQATVDQAQAALDKLRQPARQSDIDIAQASLDQARAALAKSQANPTTIGTAQATLAQQQAAAAKAASPYLPTDLESAQAQVQQAEAGVKTAEANLRDATIVAPFAGVVSAKNVSTGAMASPSTVLLEMISSDVRGAFTIEEAQVGRLALGQAATLTTTSFPGERFAGTVSIINPSADASTRSFGLKVTPQDTTGRLKAGMFAQAELVIAERPNALTVPENAVLTRDGKPVVFVVVDGKAQRRVVTPGIRAEGKVEIVSGLQAGDRVVGTGQNLLNDGDSVTVR